MLALILFYIDMVKFTNTSLTTNQKRKKLEKTFVACHRGTKLYKLLNVLLLKYLNSICTCKPISKVSLGGSS